MTKHEHAIDNNGIAQILASKAPPRPLFTETEREAIASQLRALRDRLWEQELQASIRQQKALVDLFRDGPVDAQRRRAIISRRPIPNLLDRQQVQLRPATILHADALLAGCDGHLASPPYTTGDPLVEEVGDHAEPFPGPDQWISSELAVPDEGILSLGVANGVFDNDTVHPAKHHFDSWAGPGDFNKARSSLGYYACVPGNPLQRAKTLRAAIDVTIGEPSKPFFLVDGSGWVELRGYVRLSLFGAQSNQARVNSTLFLYYGKVSDIEYGDPPLRSFTVSETLVLGPGETGCFVNVEAVLYVTRLWPQEAAHFGIIDLRSPDHDTHRIHYLFDAGGPIRIPKISLAFCPLEVLAPQGTVV